MKSASALLVATRSVVLCMGPLLAWLAGPAPAAAQPQRLSQTGLYSPGSTAQVAPWVMAFTPQYPLWSDGTSKRRWLYIPSGRSIDARQPDAWVFPVGTKLWKEFAYGQQVETRLIERLPDGSWRFASYVWAADGSDATLAPARGSTVRAAGAPGGRYEIPSQADCQACHGSAAVPVLGVSALQLSPDRDPLAAHGQAPGVADADLRRLVDRGWLRGLPAALLLQPPRIPAATPVERAALGYLHGNCAHCHNTSPQRVPLPLTLAQRVADPQAARQAVLRSAVQAQSRYRPTGATDAPQIIAPGHPEHSLLAQRMQSRNPQVQMPPLGTRLPDPEGLALIQRWIANDLPPVLNQ